MDPSEREHREKLKQALRDAITNYDVIEVTRAMLRSAAAGDAKAVTLLRTVKAPKVPGE